MIEKRCKNHRDHKPHWWSRTTRKTVTEVTAGDTFGCPGRAQLGLRTEEDPREARIAADAHSGTNWASLVAHKIGPACVCGAFYEGDTVEFRGRTIPKGVCYRHGTIQASRIARNPGGPRPPR